MPVPIAAVGSMMVQGIFKGGSLLSGLSSMVGKFKGAQQEGKSTGTEMKRMTGHAHMLRNALALIGVGGFSALLMQTPALAGGLVKIKTEMMLMANIVGRALKPALDDVATILRGIRTGNWTVVKQGITDLVTSVVELLGLPGEYIINAIWGKGAADKAREEFDAWVVGVQEAWDEGTIFDVAKAILWPPVGWAYTAFKSLVMEFADAYVDIQTKGQLFGQNVKQQGLGEALRGTWGVGKAMQLTGYDVLAARKERINNAMIDEGTWQGGEKTHKYGAEPQQNITMNIDMRGITGDIEDPIVSAKICDMFVRQLRAEQRAVMV